MKNEPTLNVAIMKTIIPGKNEEYLAEALQNYANAQCPVALTGAGISVASGIADFRSPGGLWSVFSPDKYASIDVFHRQPEKAWKLYRALGQALQNKKPNSAHQGLANLEQEGLLAGIVTQNVDNLHQVAGSRHVLEIHGDHQHLQCLNCGDLVPVVPEHYSGDIPLCKHCAVPYKPNVVLFGEAVRHLEEIQELIMQCDLLLVIGTSANVYPAAGLPALVRERGGLIYEFNLEPALAAARWTSHNSGSNYFFEGDLSHTLPSFCKAVLHSK